MRKIKNYEYLKNNDERENYVKTFKKMEIKNGLT